MKLILREYLASLREREELDAILPDLLSELGFNVYSRPQRGTVQHGVDVAALGPEGGDDAKVYLFSIKKGDLTRQEWNGSASQALRPSLDDIRDAYIPARIPPEHAARKIVICICLGGEIQEQVRQSVTGYVEANTNDRISFEEWNGDKIANLLLQGVLREDLLPKPERSHFQKAVALLDEPEVSYHHYARLVRQLVGVASSDPSSRVRVARQIYICLWVLYVWARDLENIEAPYRASELSILSVWEVMKPLIGQDVRDARAVAQVLNQLIKLHVLIATSFIEKVVEPNCGARDALAMAVHSRNAVDVNLKLFDVLGRIGMTGLWLKWLGGKIKDADEEATHRSLAKLFDIGMSVIESNRVLWLPVSDDLTTDITIFLVFWLWSPADAQRLSPWLQGMVQRYEFTVLYGGRYPTSLTAYTDLVEHPKERSKEYFEEATAGSTLIPLLAAWLTGLGRPELVSKLSKFSKEKLAHCTMQLWTPAEDSEAHVYMNTDMHGSAITDLPIEQDGSGLLETIAEACNGEHGTKALSAMCTDVWPVVLMACRHWRLPVPPEFYIDALISFRKEQQSDGERGTPSDSTT